MPLPDGVSRSKMDRLGVRLAADPSGISEDDYDLFERILGSYQGSLDLAQAKLESLGIRATTRVKSTTTLVEKLVRQETMKMKGVQDIAGARIVVDGGRLEQNLVVDQVIAAFPDARRPPRVIDRRATPSVGYRAVHVVVHHLELPIEIQVRTFLQDSWAQIVERLGDIWGRGLRYEEDFTGAERVIAGGVTRAEVMGCCREASDVIDLVEKSELEVDTLLAKLDETSPEDSAEEGEEWDLDLSEHKHAREALLTLRHRLLSLLASLAVLVDKVESADTLEVES